MFQLLLAVSALAAAATVVVIFGAADLNAKRNSAAQNKPAANSSNAPLSIVATLALYCLSRGCLLTFANGAVEFLQLLQTAKTCCGLRPTK